jgi:hypothetical protein
VIRWKNKENIIKNYGVPMAHAYNLSYSEGRDLEDRGLKPAGANSSRDTISEKSIIKKG